MDVERHQGEYGPYYRVRVGAAAAVIGPRTRADRRRFAEALAGQLGAADMTSDAFRISQDIAELAKRLGERISPKLPGMVAARLLVGLDACQGDLQRLLDTVDGALASGESLADK